MHGTERSLPRLPRILATDEIIPTMQQMIDQHRSLIDQLVGTQDISFDTIVCPIAELENAQSGPHAIIDALKYCSPSTECQSAVEEAQKLWSEYTSRPRRGLYNLLRAVRDKGQIPDLESRRLLDQMMLESEEYGYGSHLDDAALRERAARIARIKQLEAAFNRNLRQTGGDMVLTAEQATGLPEQERKERYDLASDFVRVMTNAHNADTRRRFMEARHAQYPENVPLFREAVLLRDVNARELGAPSHAATRMPYRVAESVESVERLMDDLADRLVPYGLAERERANQLKKRQLGIQDDVEDSLDPWDLLYYSAQVDQGQAGDAAAFAEYFPLVHTLNAMVALFGDCLGLRFERIPQDRVRDWAWHGSVFGWTVWDEGGGFVGHLFADIVAREYKYKGNQSVNLQPVRTSHDDGG